MSSKDQVHFGKASKPAEILSVLRWESFGQSDQKACPARRCGEVGSCTKQLCVLAVLETIRSLPESAQSLESLTLAVFVVTRLSQSSKRLSDDIA